MTFSAVILSAGNSSRMGRDKAFMEFNGQVLLARQIATVRAAAAVEIFISGRPDTDYSAFGVRVLHDRVPGAGPLAGIHAALLAAQSPRLLALAVDLPEIGSEFLRALAKKSASAGGVIPRVAGQVEPLAAIYPVSAREIAGTMLREKEFAVRSFARACVAAGLASFADFPAEIAPWFKNLNSPSDLTSESAR